MKTEKTCGIGGRPRGFCVENALDKALQVFWQKGYEGASLTDLTEAMGINRPSLYSAYGNKENLFLKVLDRYAEIYGAFIREAIEKPTAREVAESLLFFAAENYATDGQPRGCLGIQGALSCSEEAGFVKEQLISRRLTTQRLIRDRFAKAQSDGDLPKEADVEALSGFLWTVIQGMSVQSTNGATKDEMREIAKVALNAFDQACCPA